MTLGYNGGMDETYQLVFRGEIAEGQHRAVVRRRLAEALKLDDSQVDRLFSGAAVIVKKSADAKTAAAFQALFKKAGARLRIHALGTAAATAESTGSVKTAAPVGAASPAGTSERKPAQTASAGTQPQPGAGADATSNRPAADTEAASYKLLSREEIDAHAAELRQASFEITAPDYSVAEVGVELSEPRAEQIISLPEVDFTIAETGADLLTQPARVEAVELGEVNFELAEVGATIGDDAPKSVPQAPDTSHLRITGEA